RRLRPPRSTQSGPSPRPPWRLQIRVRGHNRLDVRSDVRSNPRPDLRPGPRRGARRQPRGRSQRRRTAPPGSCRGRPRRPRRFPCSTPRILTSDGTSRAAAEGTPVMRSSGHLRLLFAVALASAPATPARAAEGAPRELAAAHYARGIELANQGLYEAALE